ncbi:hypothetical protein C4B60_09370 [Jeotgalibacillus proteolyticus]|uniref:Carbon monoxide dehydrogenase n=1 Tax=Jeotgalibacillus proteolyticus TaxID=2082395 RepID=A0A2S5GDJ1_9BACL|nr:hypothetical protein [Jeotgalibacillus proteolyticus]PPA70981.1 hypothetical protein C4B60_09370 [Jeotgalibacillus proteolyticus]
MKKGVLLLFLCCLGFLTIEISDDKVSGNTNGPPQPFEEIYTEGGYKSVDAAVDDFEQHFKQEIKLPLRIPPISFTHYFGRFNNLDGEINDSLEVKFISDQFPDNHFKIDIRPIQYKIPVDKYKTKVMKLKNGKNAIYVNDRNVGFNMLVFEKDSWQYMLSIDKGVSDKVTPEILVQLADSIDY